MVASKIRASARESLTGKWGKAALLTLSSALIIWVISIVCNLIPLIGQIVLLAITTPISYGLLVSFIKLKRGEDVGYTDFLSNGFASFGKVWAVFGNTILKMILPVCLVVIFAVLMGFSISGTIVAGIFGRSSSSVASLSLLSLVSLVGYIASLIYVTIKGYLYSLSYYILNDNPNMTGKEIVEESARLMKGNRWRFFWLGLSFIGWAILSVFTLYIGILWLVPYMMVAMICFYEDLANKNTTDTPVSEN